MPETTTELEVFDFQGAELRSAEKAGNPWFVAADVARILGYRDALTMTRRLDDEDTCYALSAYQGQKRRIILISEPGIYMAVFGSQSPKAVAFKRWLAHDVIPAIRRTGQYVADERVRRALGLQREAINEVIDQEAEADRYRWRAEELERENERLQESNERLQRQVWQLVCQHDKKDDGSCIHGRSCTYVG